MSIKSHKFFVFNFDKEMLIVSAFLALILAALATITCHLAEPGYDVIFYWARIVFERHSISWILLFLIQFPVELVHRFFYLPFYLIGQYTGIFGVLAMMLVASFLFKMIGFYLLAQFTKKLLGQHDTFLSHHLPSLALFYYGDMLCTALHWASMLD